MSQSLRTGYRRLRPQASHCCPASNTASQPPEENADRSPRPPGNQSPVPPSPKCASNARGHPPLSAPHAQDLQSSTTRQVRKVLIIFQFIRYCVSNFHQNVHNRKLAYLLQPSTIFKRNYISSKLFNIDPKLCNFKGL